MNSIVRFDRLLAAATLAAVAALSLAQAVHAGPSAPEVPSTIAVEEGHKPFLVAHAVGVQIYSCNATSGGFGWAFVAPRADLYGDNGQLVATHFAGPTWQAKDGSRVAAKLVDKVTVDPAAIPWFLLSATSTSGGADGNRLVGTTFIQRIATVGGVAPAASACNAGTAGTTAEVPYTADYVFWKAFGE